MSFDDLNVFTFHYELIITRIEQRQRTDTGLFTFHYELIITNHNYIKHSLTNIYISL